MRADARIRRPAFGLAMGLALGVTSRPARADETAAYTLGEIVVRGAASGARATQEVSVVTAADIQARGARTLEEALMLLPGVNVRVGAEGVPRLDVRGFRTRHVVLLLDGIPINSAFDEQFDPSLFPTDAVARITLVQGPSSVLYGPGGLGAVIDVVTRKGSPGLRGTVGAEGADHAPYRARASLSGGAGPVDVFASAGAARVDGFPLSAAFVPGPEQGRGYRSSSDRRRENAFANAAADLGADVRVGLVLSAVRASSGVPPSVVNNPLDPFATPPRYDRIDDLASVAGQAALEWHPPGPVGARAWVFLHRATEQDTQYDDPTYRTFDAVAGSYRERVRATAVGASAQPRLELGRAGGVTLLLSAERDAWSARGTTTLAPGSAAPIDASHAVGRYSTGAEVQLEPLERIGVVAGYARHWQARDGGVDDGASALAAAHVDVAPGTRLKIAYGRAVRFPTLRDLYDPSHGNAALLPERADTFQGGVERQLPGRGVASATAWTTTARDLVQTDAASGRSTNLARVRYVGVEVAAAAQAAALRVRGSFTWLDSRDLSRDGRQEQQYTPRLKAAAEASYDFASGLSPYVSVLYVGEQFFYTKNAITPVRRGRLQDLVLVDARIAQRLLASRLSVHVGATNLLDRNYETSYGFPQPGRVVYGGAELRF